MRARAPGHWRHGGIMPRTSTGLALALVLVIGTAVAGADKKPAAPAKSAPAPAKPDTGKAAEPKSVESKDILARTATAASAEVLHVLVSWKDLAPTYANRGGQD